MKYQFKFTKEHYIEGLLDDRVIEVIESELDEEVKNSDNEQTLSITIDIRNIRREKIKIDKEDEVVVEVIQK
jgi:hypothetical protein